MIMGLFPYGDHPTFSLSVNHIKPTGITDNDRSLTIREMANIYNVENKQKKFVSCVPLLLRQKVLAARRTYRNVRLSTQIAGLTLVCNM